MLSTCPTSTPRFCGGAVPAACSGETPAPQVVFGRALRVGTRIGRSGFIACGLRILALLTCLQAFSAGSAIFAGTPDSESALDQALKAAKSENQAADAPSVLHGSANSTGHDHSADADHEGASPEDDYNLRPRGGMFAEFAKSWILFHNSYLEGWVCGLLLAIVGVIVVARDQIFIGAAVSQASTLGIAVALCMGGSFPIHKAESWLPHSVTWLCCDGLQPLMAVVFSMLAATITAQAARAKHEGHEAITGWIFLISTSLSVLVVAHSPHGLEEIHRIHSSSIIGATSTDVGIFAGLLFATVLFVVLTRSRLVLFVTDPSMAAAVGMNIGRWALMESLWLGLTVGVSIRATGMLYTFGSLVLPGLVAKHVCREVWPMFLIAPLVALAANTIGFVLANYCDFPPSQMVVAVLCVALLAAWIVRRMR